MAFIGTITITQNSNIEDFIITDTSNYGSEGAGTFSGRAISIYTVDGQLFVPQISWPFSSGNTYTVSSALFQDYSLSVVVNWNSLDPQPGSTYVVDEVVTFLNYLKQFRYSLVQNLVAQPNLRRDTNWTNSIAQLQNDITGATSATDYADQYSAQEQINDGYYLKNNQQFFF